MNTITKTVNTMDGKSNVRNAWRNGEILPRQKSALKLKFRNAHLQTVVNYLRDSAGLIIHVRPGVEADRPLDLWYDHPVTAADAMALLKQALIETGCTLIRKGPLFNVIRSQDVKKFCIPLPTV